MDFSAVNSHINTLIAHGKFPSATLCVYSGGKIVHSEAYGQSYPMLGTVADKNTRYDVASLSKIFATTVFMSLCESGIFSLDDRLSAVFPEFVGKRPITAAANALAPGSDEILGYADAGQVTWRNVLVHNSGMGWVELQKAVKTPEQVPGHIASMPFAYQTGETVLYTDLGLILMGIAIERVTGKPLDEHVEQLICKPLGMSRTGYIRHESGVQTQNVAPTEMCKWRGGRAHGFVHDENAYFLGGVAGHAGVFSTAEEVAALANDFAQSYLGKDGILTAKTVADMASFKQQNSWDRRGIGFQLRIIEVGAHSFPLSPPSFGHTGFTGTCMWVDPVRNLAFALLSNDVYGGRANRGMIPVRKSIVERILEAVDRG